MKKGTNVAFGAIIGAAVGMVAGMLTAPKSGKETRDELLFKAEEIGDDVRTKVSEVIESVTHTKDEK